MGESNAEDPYKRPRGEGHNRGFGNGYGFGYGSWPRTSLFPGSGQGDGFDHASDAVGMLNGTILFAESDAFQSVVINSLCRMRP